MLKITTAKSKTRKIGPYDDPRIFFWISYELGHEKKTSGATILWGDGVDILGQTAPAKTKFLKLTCWFAWIWTTFGLVRRARTVPNHSARTENNHRQGRPRPAAVFGSFRIKKNPAKKSENKSGENILPKSDFYRIFFKSTFGFF